MKAGHAKEETAKVRDYEVKRTARLEERLDDALENIGKVIDLALDGELFESNEAYNMLSFVHDDFQFVRKLVERRKAFLLAGLTGVKSK